MLIARPCTGVRLDARPGQGRPRGAVRRSRTAASAKKRAKVVQLVLELLGVLIARPCTGADRRPPLMRRPRGGVWPTAKLPRAQKNTRKSRATCPGIAWCADRTPVHRRPTGRPARSGPPPRRRLANGQTAASAKKHAQKSCNFCWNWIFVGAIPRAQKSCNFCWNWIFVGAIPRAQKSCNFCWNCLLC